MKLHTNIELFRNIVDLTAEKREIDREIVIKDYYVVLALKYINAISQESVFIGGTSLSKCYQIINRFSEDIDISPKITNHRAARMEAFKIIADLQEKWLTPSADVKNVDDQDYRYIYLEYADNEVNNDALLETRIKVELLTFNVPFPVEKKRISPYLMEYMTMQERIDYAVHDIVVFVQLPWRTFLEKVLLQKILHNDFLNGREKAETQIKRARDYYDIHKLWQYFNYYLPFTKEELIGVAKKRTRSDETEKIIDILKTYPLFQMYKARNIREQLEEVDKKKLSIDDLDCNEIELALKEIDAVLNNI